MPDKLPVPDFKSEREEADWYYENRDRLDDFFEYSGGRNLHEALAEIGLRIAPNAITLSLKDGDLELAQKLATERGVDPEELLADLLHGALETSKAA